VPGGLFLGSSLNGRSGCFHDWNSNLSHSYIHFLGSGLLGRSFLGGSLFHGLFDLGGAGLASDASLSEGFLAIEILLPAAALDDFLELLTHDLMLEGWYLV
jgi:hypothetical protein